jgi:hypothetical protein
MENSIIKTKPVKKNSQTVIPKQTWATFTYIAKETTYITKIFKHANIKIAYLTNNTIQLPKTVTTINFQLF